MNSKLTIPMTRAAGMGQLPGLLEESSGRRALLHVFRAEHLPVELASKPEQLLPVASLVSLFERAGRVANDRCFGLRVGLGMTVESYGAWGVYCASAPTLGEALQRNINGIRFHQTGGYMSLEPMADGVRWGYHHPAPHRGVTQHADHILPTMLKFVRAYLGDDWQPEHLDVCYPRDPLAYQLEHELGIPIKFNSTCTGFAIKQAHLAVRRRNMLPVARQLTDIDFLEKYSSRVDNSVLMSIRHIIYLRLIGRKSDLEGAARLARIGPRSLQRALRSEGTTYRELLEQVRMQRAIGLVHDTDHRIGEIAFALGYDKPGNFTRAFRRMTGRSPNELRQRRAQNPIVTL
jgi:AraC-like DNA-binding protein